MNLKCELMLLTLIPFILQVQASLQDIVLDTPYFRGSTSVPAAPIFPIGSRSPPDLIQNDDHTEARWHLFSGILEALRGIKQQEELVVLDEKLGFDGVDRKLGAEAAVQHFQAAHTLESENNWVLLNLGLMRLRAGRYHEARELFDMIIRSTTNSMLLDKAFQYKAYSYEFTGQKTEAMELFNLVKLGREIPWDAMEPDKYYFRSPKHENSDSRDFLCDIVVFHELYDQYLGYIEELGLQDEFCPAPSEPDSRPGYYYVREGRTNVAAAAKFFVENDYVIIQGLINPIELKIVQRWYKHFRVTKMLRSFDLHLQRYTGHNDRISFYYHSRLLSLHSRMAQTQVKPSYSYISYYMPIPNAQSPRPWLQGHTDRDDNEFTSSIQVLNHDKDGNNASPWPIWVDKNKTSPAYASWRDPPQDYVNSVPCYQENGDSILFRGREHNHWRESMPEETTETLTFLLHYVHEHFDTDDYKVGRGGRDAAAPNAGGGY